MICKFYSNYVPGISSQLTFVLESISHCPAVIHAHGGRSSCFMVSPSSMGYTAADFCATLAEGTFISARSTLLHGSSLPFGWLQWSPEFWRGTPASSAFSWSASGKGAPCSATRADTMLSLVTLGILASSTSSQPNTEPWVGAAIWALMRQTSLCSTREREWENQCHIAQ